MDILQAALPTDEVSPWISFFVNGCIVYNIGCDRSAATLRMECRYAAYETTQEQWAY